MIQQLTGAQVPSQGTPDYGPSLSNLPPEIWARIAGHLVTKEAARLSAVCKAFSEVQPHSLTLGHLTHRSNRVAEFLWGLRHGKAATTVSMDIWLWEQKEVYTEQLYILAHLRPIPKVLRLKADLRMAIEGCSYVPHLPVPWFKPLLAGMTQLESLELSASQVDSLPQLPQLKHLSLTQLIEPPTGDLISCIAALPSLETLHIALIEKSRMPPLDLAASDRLQAVALEYVYPEGMKLRSGVELSVDIPIWADKIPDAIRRCPWVVNPDFNPYLWT